MEGLESNTAVLLFRVSRGNNRGLSVIFIRQDKSMHLAHLIKKLFIIWWLSNQIMSESLSKSKTTKKKRRSWKWNQICWNLLFNSRYDREPPPTVLPQNRQGRRVVNNGPESSLNHFMRPRNTDFRVLRFSTCMYSIVTKPSRLNVKLVQSENLKSMVPGTWCTAYWYSSRS